MLHVLFFLILFFFSSFYAGFSPYTVLLSSQGFISIDQLQKGSRVTSYDPAKNTIVQGIVNNHRTNMPSLACKVICDNDISFVASLNQRMVANKQWRAVKDLKSGDRLKCYSSSYAIVLSVEVCNNENILYEITVEPYHTFCVTERGIIAHNHPIAIFAVAPAITSIIPVVAKTAGVMATIGAALYSLFAKNGGHGIGKNNINSPSNCSTPPLPPDDDDEFKKKHPHGRYEDVGYHKNHQSGKKSLRPKNGQEALDNSLPLDINSDMRIGVSNDEFVILNKTSDGLYHGHVRQWKELTDTMQAVLRKFNKVTKKGKIIP